MFFREKKTRKSPLLQLVENYRTANGKVSQRIIISLGGCLIPDQHRKAVAREVSHRMAGYQRFLPIDEPDVVYWTDQVLNRLEEAGKLPGVVFNEQKQTHKEPEKVEEICVNDIEHEQGVELGPCLVLLQAWKALELDDFLSERGFSPDQITTRTQ